MISLIAQESPRFSKTSEVVGPFPIAIEKPLEPSNIPWLPVNPCLAAIADKTPDSAALPECSGLLIESSLNACCNPAAIVIEVANASVN